MGKYRSRLEIIADILHIVSKGARKTHIMYQCNLSYKLLRQYLGAVLKAELVCVDDSCNEYSITPKGKQFLTSFGKYVEQSEKVTQRVNEVDQQKQILERMVSGKSGIDRS